MQIKHEYCLVLDIGGTNFRIGLFSVKNQSLSDIRRFPTPNLYSHSHLDKKQLQELVIDTILQSIKEYIEIYKEQISCVGISFAGPVDKEGNAKAAPTIFGSATFFLPIAEIIKEDIGLSVGVINDISAAAWRYSDKYSEPFCVITVSSGVGNKVFYKDDVLLNNKGYGGEIGHHTFDYSEDALPCDCGGRGHVGAIASGRGVEQLLKRECNLKGDSFKKSILGEITSYNVEEVNTYKIVEAIHKGDMFTIEIFTKSLKALASAISAMYCSIGVEKYIIIGGFAISVGCIYVRYLINELVKIGCYGLTNQEISQMVCLGEPDDNNCLIGAGIYMMKKGKGKTV